jgi:asparagine synthase (glutamine-hydrolysing)
MCGLLALFGDSVPASLDVARRALESIRHRGPDASGEWCEPGVFLGHRRLSIIDLHTGQQPMHSSDGRYVIVFNGEIYNYRELREELQRSGSRFCTKSDTEVILEGYRCWGRRVVERLNGMFAFAIWDRTARQAFIARDRLGIKPLCWAMRGDTLVVSSTMEPFDELGWFDALDPVAVRDLMTFDYIPAPRTIRKGVRKLEPGSRFEWALGSGEPCVDSYWEPPPADDSLEPPDEEELEDLLDRSVRRQMVSDVPIGVFLSGGIDSSLLVALMARHSAQPVKTYSVAFSEQEADESAIAARVAKRFETDHSVLHAEEVGAAALQQLIGALDEPFCDAALIPLFALSRLTRSHVKVTLSGDGGDEVFGGYEKYLMPTPGADRVPFSGVVQRSLRTLPWRPRGIDHVYRRTLTPREWLQYSFVHYGDFPVFRKDLGQLFDRSFVQQARIREFFAPWERIGRMYGELTDADTGAGPDADTVMRADLRTYLSENCLVKTDRASMLASLEVRVPFLDEMVLDRVLPLHASRKIVDGRLKALLFPLAKRLLPIEVWNRPKHGFNVPLETKLATVWRPVVDDALAWGERHLPIFDYAYLRRLQRINLSEQAVGIELWNPVTLITWAMARPHRWSLA